MQALWEKAEGPFAPIAPALQVVRCGTSALEPVDPDRTEQLDLFAEAA